jgi:WD40 repeat protein
MNFQKASILLVIFLLASCVNNQVTSTPTLLAIPTTRAATKLVPSQTQILHLTETPTPTFTPLVTATSLKLTREDINNALKQHDYEKFCNHYYRSLSPNKQWFMAGCEEPVVAQIINLNMGTVYSIDIRYYYPLYYRLETTIRDELWSSDGRYLFLRPHICCADGPGSIVTGVALYRVDLNNGDVWTVLPPSATEWADYAFAFSPDEKRIAYVSPFMPNVLHLLDLTTRQDVTKEFDNKFHLGALMWTPNSSQILFVGITHDIINDANTSSMFLMNASDLSFEVLIDNDNRDFIPVRYPSSQIENDVVQLSSLADDSYWLFNIRTKSLSIFPTPTP